MDWKCAPAGQWRQWAKALALALASGCTALHAAAQSAPADPLSLPLEDLLQTEVVSAERFARQVTDSASAVSVLTAEDIRRYGWRTLGEVLDHMRGLYLATSPTYLYMGARGVGGIKTMSGRVLLLIDGVPANDNYFEQTYLGYDSQIDPALIARVEYAPGAGSAMYGNNAFLGVINVITKRGRDVGGMETAVGAGSHADRYLRLTWGDRPAVGGEWLASLSVHRNDGIPSADFDLREYTSLQGAQDVRLLIKGSWSDWALSVMGMTRSVRTAGVDEVDSVPYAYAERGRDSLGLASLSRHDTLGPHWRATQRLSLGRFQYDYLRSATPVPDDYFAAGGVEGAWWLLDSQWTYDGLPGHQLVLGARLRNDTMQKVWIDRPPYRDFHLQTRSLSLSVEDQYTFNPQWQATLGLRGERRSRQPLTWSPRAALVFTPDAQWTLKLSHGSATRQLAIAEMPARANVPGERVTISEGMAEYRSGSLRLLGSLYRYRLRSPYSDTPEPHRLRVRGLELEGEWQWQGWQLQGSQAWQWARSPDAGLVHDAPRSISKLLLSAPLGSERWRASLALRRTSRYTSLYEGDSGDADTYRIPGRTVADATLTALRLDERWNLTLGVRNLFNAQNLDLTAGQVLPDHNSRTWWLEVSAAWR